MGARARLANAAPCAIRQQQDRVLSGVCPSCVKPANPEVAHTHRFRCGTACLSAILSHYEAPQTPVFFLDDNFADYSTGRPKGVGVMHHGEINLLNWYTSEFDISAYDR